MKRSLFASLLVVGLSAVAVNARAELEILGVYGIPIPNPATPNESCWGTSVGGDTFGIRINNCGADRYIYYYQTPYFWMSGWRAQIRASAGVECGIFAEPDNGGVYPVGSGYWTSGGILSPPIDVPVQTTYTTAYVHCRVPNGAYIVSVKWWLW